ncbi:MAG: PQQ-like beta-propeller repeat protein [Thermoanaerobaculia bacterium]|nr:PQQ-like beta-propeller repeat protein [Thermoanaerobaculia bacterium]
MRRATSVVPFVACVLMLAIAPLAAETVGWRMGGDGRYLEAEAPTSWSPTENVVWKTKMPSWSNASPVLLEDKGLLIVLSEPDQVVAVKSDSGEIAWTASTSDIVSERPGAHDANGWTTGTPVSDGRHVFTLFGTGVAAAHTLDGEQVWARVVEKPQHRWGNSASPALGGGNLLVHVVDLFALDPATGEEVWRAPSEPRWGSPVVTQIGGTDVVITTAGDVFRADDGAVVANGIGGLKFAVPVVQDGIVYFIEKEATAVRLPETLDGEFQELWRSRVQGSRHYVSSLVHDGLIYAISREQDFSILDAETGKVLDSRRFELYDGGSNGAYSSITLAGDKLFLGTENGASVVFKPGPEYQEIARNQVEGYRSTPVFQGDRMYLRAFDYLYCFGSSAD